jgi:hypothetical protein
VADLDFVMDALGVLGEEFGLESLMETKDGSEALVVTSESS